MKMQFILWSSAIVLVSCKKESFPGSEILQPNKPVQENISRNSASEKSFSVGNKTYVAGFTQLSQNQDAYVLCLENEGIVWSKYYDRSPDDSRAVDLVANAQHLYVAFTCTGGNTDFRASQGSFQESYGTGGGPKILFLARIHPETGNVERATFIGCRLDNGKTNTMRLKDNEPEPLRLQSNGHIEVLTTKAYDRADGRLTPNIGPDEDCRVSGGSWRGLFDASLSLLEGDCLPE